MAVRQIVGGQFQDAMGNPLANGYMTLRLNEDGRATTTQVSAGFLLKVLLGSNGSISGTVSVWPNDQLLPASTVYIVTVFTAAGEIAWSSQQVIPSGVGTFDIGTWIPNNT